MRKTACRLVFAFSFLPAHSLFAQNLIADTAFRSLAIQNTVALYHKATSNASNLYNGALYEPYFPLFEKGSHQFFKDNEFKEGSVVYDGMYYRDVQLLYDLVRDDLVLKMPSTANWMTLVKQKIERFTIDSYRFIHLRKENPFGLNEGFYNQLYEGKTSLLARHLKNRVEFIDQRSVYSRAFEKTNFILIKDGKSYTVKNKKALLRLLSDKKSQLNQHIKQNRLNFKRDFENAMVQTVKQYDELTH